MVVIDVLAVAKTGMSTLLQGCQKLQGPCRIRSGAELAGALAARGRVCVAQPKIGSNFFSLSLTSLSLNVNSTTRLRRCHATTNSTQPTSSHIHIWGLDPTKGIICPPSMRYTSRTCVASRWIVATVRDSDGPATATAARLPVGMYPGRGGSLEKWAQASGYITSNRRR